MPLVTGHPHAVWGTLRVTQSAKPASRVIPTCVGNASVSSYSICCSLVHPHVCGERAPLLDRCHNPLRYIPTYVGNATICRPSCRWLSVHPHTRGERSNLNLLDFKEHVTTDKSYQTHWALLINIKPQPRSRRSPSPLSVVSAKTTGSVTVIMP